MVPDPLAAPSRQFRRDSLYSLGVCSFSRRQLLVSLYRQCLDIGQAEIRDGEKLAFRPGLGVAQVHGWRTRLEYAGIFRHNVENEASAAGLLDAVAR